ncbi:hypothetical protein CTA2_12079 [Colletotrichum tanaceti]|uniref:Uncharacterized protein n=1 Tax=Colletotrichum tanaceti TaxID=1306861 RepID=A0A4U6X3X5_9PEZI|nr:hypothetical protein CTA2_12079 [Colletotrichum tanaceti]TKW50070.1 hypothetical protein CTA1_4648 [Colletotrichum tanaceti]
MATVRHRAQAVLWALLLSQLFLLAFTQAQSASASSLECSCENFNAASTLLGLGNGLSLSSVCPCSCVKVTVVPVTYTTVFTIYDPITSVNDSSTVYTNHTATVSGGFQTSDGPWTGDGSTSKAFAWLNSTSGLVSSSIITQERGHSTNTSASLGTSKSSGVLVKPSVTLSSILSGVSVSITAVGSSTLSANPIASSTVPAQTNVTGNRKTSGQVSSTSSPSAGPHITAIVPPGGTITVEPLTATATQDDGTYMTTSVTWLSIDIPSTTTVSGQAVATRFPSWRCISLDICNPSCLVPDEVCLPAPSANPHGYPWPEKPKAPPSSDNGPFVPTTPSSQSPLSASLTDPAAAVPTTTKAGQGGGDKGGGDGSNDDDGDGDDNDDDGDGDDSDDGDADDDHGDGSEDEHGDGDDDDGDGHGSDHHDDDDNDDDDDDDSFLLGFRIDLGTDILGRALRDIFGWGMSIGSGTNLPFGGIGGGGGGGGETNPEEPKKSLTTSASTSSCTVTYTVAPHCTQPCVVSQIRSLGGASSYHYTTSCATATCRTTQMCTTVEQTTTTTSFTTKKPQRTAGCMPKKCPACQHHDQQDSADTHNLQAARDPPLSKELAARQTLWDDVILRDTLTEPETWQEGEFDWWEKMRRVAKSYGPGLHIDSKYHMDSSSSWTPFGNVPHGGGAGPVWGCAIVVAFSPRGVYANHLWEIPNFAIPPDEEHLFHVERGYDEDYYFKQNVDMFLHQGSLAFPFQTEYPALAPLTEPGGPLHAEDFRFFRAIVFVPTLAGGEMLYKRATRKMIDILSGKINIEKKHITLYGYRPREDLGKDFDYDLGRATPPPRIRASNPWDGLFSWLYTPKGPSGQRELVLRYEKDVIHREAWCGDGRAIPDAPPSNFDLRPKNPGDDAPSAPPTKNTVLKIRQGDTTVVAAATCGRFIVCGLGNPEALCGDYRKYPPPSLSGGQQSSSSSSSSSLSPQKRQLPPSNGPTKAERELSTDIMIDPEDGLGGEIWWWDRMRNAVDERGAGFGGHPDSPGHWSTSAMVTLDEEVDGSAANRPRFGGAGPVWGCTAIVVASPEAVWTGHVWELPSHARGEAHGREAFEQWSSVFPRPTREYFQEEFLDFLDHGNTRGNFRQLHAYKFPGRNPGLRYMFMEGGAFDPARHDFVWVGIVTRSYRNLDAPRVQYDWQIQMVHDKFVAWGVDPANIRVKAYPARLDFTAGGSQIQPHWGILSWQYHPRHREGDHEVKKMRIRFEKELLFEKSWCGSGKKMVVPPMDEGFSSSSLLSSSSSPQRKRQQQKEEKIDHDAEEEACKMFISSKESSASATRVSTAVPEPTQACTNDAECASLSCPGHRISACYHELCHCVILANPNNTEVLTGTIYATPTTTLDASQTPVFPISWLLPNLTSTVASRESSIVTNVLSLNSSTSTYSTSFISTIFISTSFSSTSTAFTSTLSASASGTISSSPSSMSTPTPGACTAKQDCSGLKCADNQYADCRIKDGTGTTGRPGCRCFDRPNKVLDVCHEAADCANVACEARHTPTCRPLVDFEGAATSVCLCDADPVLPGATCLVDTHCDGLPCDSNQRGVCASNACRCGFFLPEGAGCSAHDDCAAIRCSEAEPFKSCSPPPGNACACSASRPPPRRAEGDACDAHDQCATIGCTDLEVSVCEVDRCRCRAFACRAHADCASAPACAAAANAANTANTAENLRCEAGRCICRPCTDKFKILGCGSDEDCNHCCPRGRLPTCVYGCQAFWCGKECQCEPW